MKNLTKQKMNSQQGFTLIELVVVIVILGILAVTAAPKFIDLTSDARKSVMEGVNGSIESAVSLAQAKALIKGQTGATGVIEIGTKFYALVHGYPAALSLGNKSGTAAANAIGIIGLVDLEIVADGGDFIVTDAATSLFQHSGASDVTECQLSYENAADKETRPDITADYDKC